MNHCVQRYPSLISVQQIEDGTTSCIVGQAHLRAHSPKIEVYVTKIEVYVSESDDSHRKTKLTYRFPSFS